MEGSSFSDPAVIKEISENFVPLYLNMTEQGFPDDVPALKPYKKPWKTFEALKWGFATSVVVDPTGKKILGQSGSGFSFEWKRAVNYNPRKYLSMLLMARSK